MNWDYKRLMAVKLIFLEEPLEAQASNERSTAFGLSRFTYEANLPILQFDQMAELRY